MDDLVTLEAYAEENRTLIRHNRYDEAIAICKHILHYYPKQIESYRQMGEAYLEKDELEHAVDLFRRVLSADPENVIAYVGLATAFEKQHLIDEAVWHLERADEIEPGNFEIHKELLRLYGDAGKPRQRLKLSPAGLARLYDQEGLYSQAIQELRGIVDATPSRYDARTALAETLWHAGRIRESAELAQNILTSLPYCLKANLILGTAWKESGVADYETYLNRAQELDPSHKTAVRLLGARSPFSVTQVSVPRYVQGVTPPSMPRPPAASATQTATEAIEPTAEGQATTVKDLTAESLTVVEEVAGSTPLETETEPTIKPNLPGANLPPWLVSPSAESSETALPIQTPPASADTAIEPSTAAVESAEGELPPWLRGESVAAQQSEPTLAESPESKPATAAVESTEGEPTWIQGETGTQQQSEPTLAELPKSEEATAAVESTEGELPLWLRGETATQQRSEPTLAELPESEEATAAVESTERELPPWLKGETATQQQSEPIAESPETASEQLPTWLESPTMEAGAPSTPEEQSQVGEPKPAEGVPEWMRGLEMQGPPAADTEPARTEQAGATEEYVLPSFLAPEIEGAKATEEQAARGTSVPSGQELETAAEQPEQALPASQPGPTIEENAAVPVDQAVETKLEATAEQPEQALAASQPGPTTEENAPVPVDQAVATQPPETVEPGSSPPVVVEMPTALPTPVEGVPSIAEAPSGVPAATTPKRKRQPKGYEHLVLARKHRGAGQTNDALTEYDYIVQHAPRLVNEVIADLEILTAQPDAPLEAHRILGDAYTRADRLSEALSRYQYVLGRTSNS